MNMSIIKPSRLFVAGKKRALAVLCSTVMGGALLAQETPKEQKSQDTRQEMPPSNGLLEVTHSAPLANQVVDGDIVFTSPGQFTYPRDIRLSDNFGGLRFFGADSLTATPAGAAIQFFGNNAAPYSGQLYLDSGAHDAAALIFRTALTGGRLPSGCESRLRATSASGRRDLGQSSM